MMMKQVGWTGPVCDPRSLSTVDPPVQQAIEWAWHQAGMDDHRTVRWEKGASRAGWMPRLEIGGDFRGDTRDGESEDDAISVTSTGVTIGPPERGWDWYRRSTWRVSSKVVWDLGAVAFNRDQIAISQERRRLSEEKASIAKTIIHFYSQRQKTRDAITVHRCVSSDIRDFAESGAMLNALTGTERFGVNP